MSASDADDAAFLRDIGERVRHARAQRGMPRRLLSQHSQVSERYIAQLEAGTGNVSILLLRHIAAALGVAVTDLLADRAAEPSMPGRDPNRDSRIALIGLRGAGKTSLGRRLAERRKVPFHELDREIERAAGMELREIFERDGQPGFRRLERQTLDRLLVAETACVIATGGSIVADPATFAHLLAHCRAVWIRATPEEHMQRVIAQGDLRPMQDNGQAMDDLRAILASRETLYSRADLTLDTSGRSLDESAASLFELLA